MHWINSKRFENIRAYGWAKKYDRCATKSERYFGNFEACIITLNGMWRDRDADNGGKTKFFDKSSLNKRICR